MKLDVRYLVSLAGVACAPALLSAQQSDEAAVPSAPHVARFVLDLPDTQATVASTGQAFVMDLQEVWKPICGPGVEAMSQAQLAAIAASHHEMMRDPAGQIIVDNSPGDANINIVYVLAGSVPASAVPAFAAAEAYIESLFADPITVTVTCSFASLSPGVLGGTGSTYGFVTYSGSRSGLVAGMDANDTIQSSLPSGSTVPVRYKSSSIPTNEDRVFWTIANYNSTVGSAAGNAASMQYSTNFAWDFDPSNGITSGTYSFLDVIIHETGHALGFTSGVDFRINDIETMDLYRFQRTDGGQDYNPDTLAEFTVRPRLARFNAPSDAHNTDFISSEIRMSDGSPSQASHLRDQSPPLGLMDPTLGFGQTFYPGFFTTSDLAIFDAIGYDR